MNHMKYNLQCHGSVGRPPSNTSDMCLGLIAWFVTNAPKIKSTFSVPMCLYENSRLRFQNDSNNAYSLWPSDWLDRLQYSTGIFNL